MAHRPVYDFIKFKMASMEYLSGRDFPGIRSPGVRSPGITSAQERPANLNKISGFFATAAQVKSGKAPAQKSAVATTLDVAAISDSIFIVRSLFMAIAKQATSKPLSQAVAVAELERQILDLRDKPVVSDIDFFAVNNRFFDVLSNLHGFQRVTEILASEKLTIDRILRLTLKQPDDFVAILSLYFNVITSIQAAELIATQKAFGALTNAFEKCLLVAKAQMA